MEALVPATEYKKSVDDAQFLRVSNGIVDGIIIVPAMAIDTALTPSWWVVIVVIFFFMRGWMASRDSSTRLPPRPQPASPPLLWKLGGGTLPLPSPPSKWKLNDGRHDHFEAACFVCASNPFRFRMRMIEIN